MGLVGVVDRNMPGSWSCGEAKVRALRGISGPSFSCPDLAGESFQVSIVSNGRTSESCVVEVTVGRIDAEEEMSWAVECDKCPNSLGAREVDPDPILRKVSTSLPRRLIIEKGRESDPWCDENAWGNRCGATESSYPSA